MVLPNGPPKNGLIILFLVTLPVLLLSCSERYKEPVPFFDGLFLEYETEVKTFTGSEKITTTYNVQSIDNDHFKIIETEKPILFGHGVNEYFVDVYGRVYKSSLKDYEGEFSPIWMPAQTMEIGDTFDEKKLIGRNRWDKWNVVVVKSQISAIGAEWYYDANTGFLVGLYISDAIGGKVTRKLINTNANIPVVQ